MKRKLLAGLFAATAVVATGVGTAAAAPAGKGGGRPTIAQVLLSDSASDDANGFDRRWFDYDIATQVVLPNDLAFRTLVHDLTGTWPATEKDTFDAVASLGLDTVGSILTYHIVGAKLSPLNLLHSNGQQETTLNGAKFTVAVRAIFIRLQDNDPDAADPYVVQPNVGGKLAN